MSDEATVERVARAIYEAASGPWDHASDYGQDIVRREARAAIAALQPQVSPELIEKLGKLANYLTEQGEYEACDLIDTVVERVTKPALQPQDGLAELRALSEKATKGEWQHGIDRAHFMAPEIRKADGSFFVGTKDADAAFIVACVNFVRAEIERIKS